VTRQTIGQEAKGERGYGLTRKKRKSSFGSLIASGKGHAGTEGILVRESRKVDRKRGRRKKDTGRKKTPGQLGT